MVRPFIVRQISVRFHTGLGCQSAVIDMHGQEPHEIAGEYVRVGLWVSMGVYGCERFVECSSPEDQREGPFQFDLIRYHEVTVSKFYYCQHFSIRVAL